MTTPNGPDDLTDLFGPEPIGASQPVRFRQGVVLTFNPVTLENTVRVGSTVLTNLPLLGVGEATLLAPGSVVAIRVIGDDTKTYYIEGRIVTPNTADAFDAIALLSANIHTDTVSVQETYTSDTVWGDLATFGPSVTVTVRQTGRLLVICTTQIQWAAPSLATLVEMGGHATVELSGANTIAAATAAATLQPTFEMGLQVDGASTITHIGQSASTQQAVFEGLSAGETTVTMKYKTRWPGTSIDYGRRTLTVFTL